jgi:hypothetical protein
MLNKKVKTFNIITIRQADSEKPIINRVGKFKNYNKMAHCNIIANGNEVKLEFDAEWLLVSINGGEFQLTPLTVNNLKSPFKFEGRCIGAPGNVTNFSTILQDPTNLSNGWKIDVKTSVCDAGCQINATGEYFEGTQITSGTATFNATNLTGTITNSNS